MYKILIHILSHHYFTVALRFLQSIHAYVALSSSYRFVRPYRQLFHLPLPSGSAENIASPNGLSPNELREYCLCVTASRRYDRSLYRDRISYSIELRTMQIGASKLKLNKTAENLFCQTNTLLIVESRNEFRSTNGNLKLSLNKRRDLSNFSVFERFFENSISKIQFRKFNFAERTIAYNLPIALGLLTLCASRKQCIYVMSTVICRYQFERRRSLKIIVIIIESCLSEA